MGKVPETDGGLVEEAAIQAGEMLRKGWDVLRSLQFNPRASILRYTKSGGRPDLGIPPEETLAEGLADLDVYVSDVNMREVFASRGLIEITDKLFVFYTEVKETDQLLYNGKTYAVIQIKAYDPESSRCHAVGRAT